MVHAEKLSRYCHNVIALDTSEYGMYRIIVLSHLRYESILSHPNNDDVDPHVTLGLSERPQLYRAIEINLPCPGY